LAPLLFAYGANALSGPVRTGVLHGLKLVAVAMPARDFHLLFSRATEYNPTEVFGMLVAVRRTARSTLFFALCFFLDLADPFTPGAWSFESNQSIEAASAAPRTMSVPSVPMSPPLQQINPVDRSIVKSPRPVVSAVSEWTVPRRLGHPAAADPSPLAEDQ
jgi:hypothetical protein